jgi:DNA modification methylase
MMRKSGIRQEAVMGRKPRAAKSGVISGFYPYNIARVSDLLPNVQNARTHSDEQVAQLAAAITAFGFTNPILVDETGLVIAGHGRLLAASRLGMVQVPSITVTGLSAAQKRALSLADNKLALNAGWDEELLRSELSGLLTDGFDLALTGFSKMEIADLTVEQTIGLTDPDDAPALQKDAVSVLGDTWLLGRHRIRCGDSTDAATVAALLGADRPRLMVTDPPYGVSYDPSWRIEAGAAGAGTATGKVLNDDRADWREAWALFPGDVAYVWHGGLHAALVAESLAAVKFGVRAQVVWVKTRPVFGRGNYHWQHEPAFFVVREGADGSFVQEHDLAAYAVREKSTAEWRGGRKQSTVWFIEHLKSDTGHGTQKPVECMRRPIENNSVPGSFVYDPFMGSGTTLIAAEMTGRAALGVELSPHYCDVICRRYANFVGDYGKVVLASEPGGLSFEKVREMRGGEK